MNTIQQPKGKRVLWLMIVLAFVCLFVGGVVFTSTRGLREANRILNDAELLGEEEGQSEPVIPEGYVPFEYDDFLDEAIEVLDEAET